MKLVSKMAAAAVTSSLLLLSSTTTVVHAQPAIIPSPTPPTSTSLQEQFGPYTTEQCNTFITLALSANTDNSAGLSTSEFLTYLQSLTVPKPYIGQYFQTFPTFSDLSPSVKLVRNALTCMCADLPGYDRGNCCVGLSAEIPLDGLELTLSSSSATTSENGGGVLSEYAAHRTNFCSLMWDFVIRVAVLLGVPSASPSIGPTDVVVVSSTDAPTTVSVVVTESPVVAVGIVTPTFSPVVIDIENGDGDVPTTTEPTGSTAPVVVSPPTDRNPDSIITPTPPTLLSEVPTTSPTTAQVEKLGPPAWAIIVIIIGAILLLILIWFLFCRKKSPQGLKITHVHYDGKVKGTESDEYVEITNTSTSDVDISGCILEDVNKSGSVGATFTFPEESKLLKPNEKVRVYTNQVHEETGGYSFESGTAIWRNTGGKAVLKDVEKEVLDVYKYVVPPPPPTVAKKGDIVISTINYDGKVKRSESDEYVEIKNTTKKVVDISNCILEDINDSGKVGTTFTFPENSTVEPGKSVRVYTNQVRKEYGGYSFGSGRAIWNNISGKAVLKSASGELIDEYSYKAPPPPPPTPPKQEPVEPVTFHGGIVISKINVYGQGRSQSDEYVEITNTRAREMDISGYTISSMDVDKPVATFTFPESTLLGINESVCVYTNEEHKESGGHSFGSDTEIWNDLKGSAVLTDKAGDILAEFKYDESGKAESSYKVESDEVTPDEDDEDSIGVSEDDPSEEDDSEDSDDEIDEELRKEIAELRAKIKPLEKERNESRKVFERLERNGSVKPGQKRRHNQQRQKFNSAKKALRPLYERLKDLLSQLEKQDAADAIGRKIEVDEKEADFGGVIISHINVYGKNDSQSDEYVEVTNTSYSEIDISGYLIQDINTNYAEELSEGRKEGVSFKFPEGTMLKAGKSVMIYTNEEHADSGGYSFKFDSEVWNDLKGKALLMDNDGKMIGTYEYDEAGNSKSYLYREDFVEKAKEAEEGDIVISSVNFKGTKASESDEYVEITNKLESPVDVSGFIVEDVTTSFSLFGKAKFKFPESTVLVGGKIVRVYTNEIHEEYGGFSFGSKKEVWNNSGGTARLTNAAGKTISEFKYVDIVVPKATAGDIIISTLYYDGQVKRTEADEYVEIENKSETEVDLSGCTLCDINVHNDKEGAKFTFPADATLKAGKSVKIYTNQKYEGHYSFNSKRAIWNNTAGKAVLESAGGVVIDEYMYVANIAPSPTPLPTPLPSDETVYYGGVVISDINVYGQEEGQSDEYVEITNTLKVPIDITGYSILDYNTDFKEYQAQGQHGSEFTFEKSTVLKAGESVRIYTNEEHAESGGYSFKSKNEVWNDREGMALLKDEKGDNIAQFKYKNGKASCHYKVYTVSGPAEEDSGDEKFEPKSSQESNYIGDIGEEDESSDGEDAGKPDFGGVVISEIKVLGEKESEADEYVAIRNISKLPIDIAGYVLDDVNVNYAESRSLKGASFTFPEESTLLKAGESVRVYTNEVHQEHGGYSFESETEVWFNVSGKAVLKDAEGNMIGKYRYTSDKSTSFYYYETRVTGGGKKVESGDVIISKINHKGKNKSQSDEYIEIENTLNKPVDISDCTIHDVNNAYSDVTSNGLKGATFTFPIPTLLEPKQKVRVYTNEIHEESGGYSFQSKKEVWHNSGGMAVLKDAYGDVVHEVKYDVAGEFY